MDWGLVTQYYGRDFNEMGGETLLNYEVNGFQLAAESQAGSKDGNQYKIRITGTKGVSKYLF